MVVDVCKSWWSFVWWIVGVFLVIVFKSVWFFIDRCCFVDLLICFVCLEFWFFIGLVWDIIFWIIVYYFVRLILLCVEKVCEVGVKVVILVGGVCEGKFVEICGIMFMDYLLE